MENQNMTSAAATENSVTKASRSASTAPFAEKLNKDTMIYWISTGIVCAVMVFSAVNFNLSNPLGPMKGAFAHLGFPSYFRIELTVAKILGVLALLIPTTPRKIKDFAYSGFAITLISASIAHFSSGDSLMFIVDPLFFLALLAVSYAYSNKNIEQVD
jgi:hypothetical protein